MAFRLVANVDEGNAHIFGNENANGDGSSGYTCDVIWFSVELFNLFGELNFQKVANGRET